ncbi:MAG: hypothetical protein K2X04_05360 [Burkholderiales bacterium]|nr:hypothetical protein [Burkholderiales bacterium]
MIKNIILFLVTASLLVVGQALWKIASGQLSGAAQNGVTSLLIKLITSIPFIIGCIFYILATGLWIYLLGQYEYSKIYPVFVGTCVIVALIVGYLFFGENQHLWNKVIGCIVIIIGIYISTNG